jgi:MoxR-like ATPase
MINFESARLLLYMLDETRLQTAAKLRDGVLAPMKQWFTRKDEIIDLLGLCLIGGENLFILGPPGTAKSALVRELGLRLQGHTFEYLLTRFTEPNELFGPFDIRKLREGILETNTEGMLPEASLVFLDELLNANSAILNSVLTVLNERVLRRGREVIDLPLLMVVGASNHLPEEEALQALFDRFLLRVRSDNVPDDELAEVLAAGWRLAAQERDERPAPVTAAQVRELQLALPEVRLTPAMTAFIETVKRLRRAGILISDRRAVKLQRLVAASALMCGRSEAQISDLWVLRYIWDTEEQQELLRSVIDEVIDESSKGETSHPRARSQSLPDPELLSSEIDSVTASLGGTEADDPERAVARDRLTLIAARCQWIENSEQRAFVNAKLEAAWLLAGDPGEAA